MASATSAETREGSSLKAFTFSFVKSSKTFGGGGNADASPKSSAMAKIDLQTKSGKMLASQSARIAAKQIYQ